MKLVALQGTRARLAAPNKWVKQVKHMIVPNGSNNMFQTMCFFYANYLNDLFWRPTKVSPGHIALGMVPGLVDCDPCLVIGCCRNGETLSGCWERQMVVILNREPQRKGSSDASSKALFLILFFLLNPRIFTPWPCTVPDDRVTLAQSHMALRLDCGHGQMAMETKTKITKIVHRFLRSNLLNVLDPFPPIMCVECFTKTH